MALSRRTGARFQASIWPGFVDAMTGLLLVLMFVLTIFMVLQYVLRETITGQETQLNELSAEVAALADALGLEQDRSATLDAQVGALSSELSILQTQLRESEDVIGQQNALIAQLTGERDTLNAALSDAETQITGFEAQVAGLLAQRREAATAIEGLEAREAALLSAQEALSLALAQARSEIDESAEAARLAAARREALEAMIAQLETDGAAATEQLSALEAQRLVDAAAADALRERLANADSELTAMTLALEEQRQQAEDTLTLLAAARVANETLDTDLAEAVAALAAAQAQSGEVEADVERQTALLALANAALAEEQALSADSQRQVALLNEQVAALRGELGRLQALLDLSNEADVAANVQIESLTQDLNTAMARALLAERRNNALEAAEVARLAAQAEELERYRSDFLGLLRTILEDVEGVRIVGDRFVFSSEVLFEQGAAELSEDGQREIAKVAGILRDVAGDIPDGIDWVIRVDGHTDNVPLSGQGEFANNWELSQARALSVVLYMVNFLGIPPERLAANGFGQYQPINTADTEAARAQNRRIELKLTER